MSGSKKGGLKAAATIKRKYGDDFYKKTGALGGAVGHTGGFGAPEVGKDGMTGVERAIKYGRLGGRKSKRGPRR